MVSFQKARDFVYGNGVMWEKALFSYLFEDGSVERVHQCLLCYKNPDGGWGNDLEHDIKCPASHVLALEFLLAVMRDTGLPPGNLLDGTVNWVEGSRRPDGSLANPDSIVEYPLAPWWIESKGQNAPDSISGNLSRLGLCSPSLAASTRGWVQDNLPLERVLGNEWLFMAYHAFDYFMSVEDFPDVEAYRRATVENIVACAEAAPEKQYYEVLHFAPDPDSVIARAMPPVLLNRCIEHLLETQRDDGGWDDEHGLPQWRPYTTMLVLLGLKRYGKW